jgi:hypothetical protein
VSYCVWGEGTDSLLPVTQKVVVMRRGEQGPAAIGEWDLVREVAGDPMEPTEHSPRRGSWCARSPGRGRSRRSGWARSEKQRACQGLL